MEFFIDTADLTEIKDALDMGILSGVTTNPTVIAKSKKSFAAAIGDIANIIGEERTTFAEVIALEAPAMIEEGRRIADMRKNMVVKLPMLAESMKAISVLSKEGVKTCATVCFSAAQALVAALAGADYVAPFIGRTDDAGADGLRLIEDIKEMYLAQRIKTKIVCASVRSAGQIVAAAKCGAEIVTMNHGLMMSLLFNPSTDLTLKQFLIDWEMVPEK